LSGILRRGKNCQRQKRTGEQSHSRWRQDTTELIPAGRAGKFLITTPKSHALRKRVLFFLDHGFPNSNFTGEMLHEFDGYIRNQINAQLPDELQARVEESTAGEEKHCSWSKLEIYACAADR